MTPLAVLIGIVMGSAVTLTMGLGMVLVVLIAASSTQAELTRDLIPLFWSFILFLALAAIGAWAFIWELRQHRWRFVAQGCMWLAVVVVGWHYWPTY